MSFYQKYLSKIDTKKYNYKTKSKLNLKQIIVIPCFNEDNIIETIRSLQNNNYDKSYFDILIVINHSIDDDILIKKQNSITQIEINNLVNVNEWKNIFVITAFDLQSKKSGVGFARKIGMDLALLEFSKIKNEKGIIVSLDADTKVELNYLQEIEKTFVENKIDLATIYFEHQINLQFTNNNFAIILYEMYLRYFLLSMKFISYKNILHTLGSAFAVSAEAYSKYGGMVTKKAGEDFYFLNKIITDGNYKYIKTTKVFPSSRESTRVPFGTGPEVKKININNKFETYDFNAFIDLKPLISGYYNFFNISDENYKTIIDNMPISLQKFLLANNFKDVVLKISKNSTNIKSFEKAYFKWFSVFKVIKFLNFSHSNNYYKKQDVIEQTNKYLESNNFNKIENNNYELLKLLRNIEKDTVN